MKATTQKNIVAIFGSVKNDASMSRKCKISGRSSRTIPGRLCVHTGNNASDLWVWTDQPRRVTQDVHARIDLSSPDAMAELAARGVLLD